MQRFLIILAFVSVGANAQWLNFPTPGTPRTKDGKPNLTAPTPRALDGKPDLSGVWNHEITSVAEVKRLFGNRFDTDIALAPPGMEIGTQHKYGFDILIDFKPEEALLTPKAAEVMRKRAEQKYPPGVCMGRGGVPLAGLLSDPIKIVQSPALMVLLYEANNLHRQIYTDGRTLPKETSLAAYLGYSAGHWQGDTLVVESEGFNDKTVLDLRGHPHSEDLHITERFHRRDFGHMDVEMTFTDAQMYTKPFTIKIPHYLLADEDIFEMYCTDNEKDAPHLGKN